MIDVVHVALAHFQFDEAADHFHHVLCGEDPLGEGKIQRKPVVHLEPADRRQIIPLRVDEQILKQELGRIHGRHFSGPQALVDFHPGFFLRRRPFSLQGIQNDRRGRHVVQINHLETRRLQLEQPFKHGQGQPLIFFNQHLPFFRIHDFRQHRSSD